MKIARINLENFVCFLEEEFEFADGLNIVSAKNGAGKSQLFNAFYWTLFDQVYDRKEGFILAESETLIPDYFRLDTSPEEFAISVTISLQAQNFPQNRPHEEVDYEFKRELRLKRVGSSEFKIIIPSSLEIFFVSSGETTFIEESMKEDLISRLFPSKIRKFMWYVGETMKDLIDFENGQALEYALEQISYYPIYKRINSQSEGAEETIDGKIEKHLRKAKKLNRDEEQTIKDIEEAKSNIKKWKTLRDQAEKKSKDLEYECSTIADKLKGFDHFLNYKSDMLDLESKISQAKYQIQNLEERTKENLITRWMLNGCRPLIASSKTNLELLNTELQKVQETNNPIPTNLPGSDYVQTMIDDCRCYICERDVEPDSDAFKALQRRVNDIEINRKERVLQENYTELNRFKNRLARLLPTIEEEISEVTEQKDKLINKRNRLQTKKQNLFVELGIPEDQKEMISKGAASANDLMSQYDLKKKLKEREDLKVHNYQDDIASANRILKTLQEARQKFISHAKVDMIEEGAIKYVRIITDITSTLKGEAYDLMIREIEGTSNKLYAIYLSNDPPGMIKINKQVDIVDFETEEPMDNLSTAQEAAGKLSVINAILSLSESKMNVSFPLIMDAPTSDFDPENTISITKNFSSSFSQIIIMSKDYDILSAGQRKELVTDANISNYYELRREIISKDVDLSKYKNLDISRTNRKSVKYKLN
jgi:DNA sulfur modification protein DndD